MKYYKVRNQIRVRIVADKDVDLVPSHWVDVTDTQVPRDCDKPNVKFDRKVKPKTSKKKKDSK
jgi:hypothetical protein